VPGRTMRENINTRETLALMVIVSIDPPQASRHNALMFQGREGMR
jgi:hypothetical protein